jgi:hypothetical protein
MARPLKEISWDDFDKLCAIQCTGEEIAAFFEIDYDTLNSICKRERGKGFSDCFAQKRQSGKISLRRRQFQSALEGNPSMMIWLGKNWLGQQDQQVVEGTVKIEGFRVVEDDFGDDSQQAAS